MRDEKDAYYRPIFLNFNPIVSIILRDQSLSKTFAAINSTRSRSGE